MYSGRNNNAGFTLIELIMVITIISISAVTILSGFNQVARASITINAQQLATLHAQSCGEYIIRSRRDTTNNYSGISSNSCDILALPSGYTRTVSLTSPFNDASCPQNTLCTQVVISVSNGGILFSQLTTMIVDYSL